MKNLFKFFAAGLVSLTMLTSCDDQQFVTIDIPMEYSEMTFTIPANTQPGTSVVTERNVASKIDSVLKANGLKKEDINSIKMSDMKFTMLDGDANNNFKVMQSINAEMRSDVNNSWVMLGEISNNPNTDAHELTMPVNSGLELKPYLLGDQFTFKVTGTLRAPLNKDVTVRAHLKFDIQAGK